MPKLFSGLDTLDSLRIKAAIAPTGIIRVSVEELNSVMGEVEQLKKERGNKMTKHPKIEKCDDCGLTPNMMSKHVGSEIRFWLVCRCGREMPSLYRTDVNMAILNWNQDQIASAADRQNRAQDRTI